MNQPILTQLERTILINQFKLLALNSENQVEYDLKIEILERGYESEYYKVLNTDEHIPEEVGTEVRAILHMFRVIENSLTSLTKDEKEEIKAERLRFVGFDHHEQHYHYLDFIVQRLGQYKEFKEMDYNTYDSTTIIGYRRLMEKYNEIKEEFGNNLSKEKLTLLLKSLE